MNPNRASDNALRQSLRDKGIKLLAKEFPGKRDLELKTELDDRLWNSHKIAIEQLQKVAHIRETDHESLYFTEEQEVMLLIMRDALFSENFLTEHYTEENLKCILGILPKSDFEEGGAYGEIRKLGVGTTLIAGRLFQLQKGLRGPKKVFGCCLGILIVLAIIVFTAWKLVF